MRREYLKHAKGVAAALARLEAIDNFIVDVDGTSNGRVGLSTCPRATRYAISPRAISKRPSGGRSMCSTRNILTTAEQSCPITALREYLTSCRCRVAACARWRPRSKKRSRSASVRSSKTRFTTRQNLPALNRTHLSGAARRDATSLRSSNAASSPSSASTPTMNCDRDAKQAVPMSPRLQFNSNYESLGSLQHRVRQRGPRPQ